jgi:thymidine kinase
MVTEGAQVVVGDVDTAVEPAGGNSEGDAGHVPVVGYETLCRRHFMRRVTAHGASIIAKQDELLPFEVDACLWHGANN